MKKMSAPEVEKLISQSAQSFENFKSSLTSIKSDIP